MGAGGSTAGHPSASSSGATKTVKGVTYNSKGQVVDCLFCRIAHGRETNPLWYRDERVAVFVPREPAAVVHLLIIPVDHVKNVANLTPDNEDLLLHMRRVAIEQLAAHSTKFDLGSKRFRRMAEPPAYDFPRGLLPSPTPNPTPTPTSGTPSPTSDLMSVGSDGSNTSPTLHPNGQLAFHKPPFNSIDHLHLHALWRPYAGFKDSLHFWEGRHWVVSLDSVLLSVRGKKIPS